MGFKPLLAATVDDAAKLFERHDRWLASPKLDGVRCLMMDGIAVSRNFKPFPNKHLQAALAGLHGLDGELIVGQPTHKDVFQLSQSGIMSIEGRPQFKFFVFDTWAQPGEMFFEDRLRLSKAMLATGDGKKHPYCLPVVHKVIKTYDDLMEYEGQLLAQGYEGVMLRHPAGAYKHGRSTLNEGILLKLKRFSDSEAVVLGLTELMHNANEQTRDALGRAQRSSHKANKFGTNMLGALKVRDVASGVEFEIGTGFTEQQRIAIWEAADQFVGRQLTYKFQPTGVKDKPRFPVFKAWRAEGT